MTMKSPMAMTALGEAILEERQFVGGPNQVVRNVLRSDKRFYYDPENRLVGLLEWGMPNQTANSQVWQCNELAYVLDTFPIVWRKDEEKYGEYRTKRMVLEAYDELEALTD